MNVIDRLKDLTRPTGEEDLLEVTYPTPRWSIPPRYAALLAAAVVGVVLLWLLARPSPEVPGEPVAGLPAVTAEPVVEEPGEVVIAVVGQVAHPGLLSLSPGARVADALAQAEPLPDADLFPLNQAQRLSDGQQLVVPKIGEVRVGKGVPGPENTGVGIPGAGLSGAAGVVSLNSASAGELTTLPGVGQATAAAIISHRETVGGFTSLEQLLEVKGIGPAKYEALKEQVGL